MRSLRVCYLHLHLRLHRKSAYTVKQRRGSVHVRRVYIGRFNVLQSGKLLTSMLAVSDVVREGNRDFTSVHPRQQICVFVSKKCSVVKLNGQHSNSAQPTGLGSGRIHKQCLKSPRATGLEVRENYQNVQDRRQSFLEERTT